MAAYGALVSVMQIMNQLHLHRHPHPPISLDKKHSEALTANVTFLQEFLEGYNPHVSYTAEADPLESRIAEAAYAAEDVIESYIADQINPARSTDHAEEISSIEFSQGLEKVIEEMDLIKMEIKEKNMKEKMGVQIIKKQSTTDAVSSRSSSTAHAQKVTTMVGFDDVLIQMLDMITRGERVRQIIPIVGMGGLGKTTLAQNIYENPLIKEHFDVRAWSTIFQVPNARNILSEILGQVDKDHIERDLSEGDLGVKLYQYLIGRRYLIVMDDMWSIEAWDVVRRYFPENKNGSRIVITTRLSNLASKFNPSDSLEMKFLDKASSWSLFSKTVFGDEICPPELEEIGKKIVEGCRGLPLSIVVAGGLLSKSEATRENWEVIEENLSSVVNSEDNGSCLQILYMSYNNLPAYMKICFLHLGLLDEDDEIPVNIQIQQWVAEGYIRPRDGKSLEEVAEEYVEELIDRNLILVEKRDHCGDVETFKVHDLVRDLAMREAKKDRFLCSLMQRSSDDTEISRRSYGRIASSLYKRNRYVEDAGLLFRSRDVRGGFPEETLSLPSFRLRRVFMVGEKRSREYDRRFPRIPSHPWNLHTIYIVGGRGGDNCPLVIWKMPQLRAVMSEYAFRLPDIPLRWEEVVLENLHTLSEVGNLKFSEELLKRIPNVRILKLSYHYGDDYCLNYLRGLNKLQDLHLSWDTLDSLLSMQELALPYSLKQLMLIHTKLPWEEMASKIGCLPLLQVLILEDHAFVGSEWETVEGQFPSLKFLSIDRSYDLERWITDDCTHFPRLKHLVLRHLDTLMEIPSSIGDIPTLRSIKVEYCSDSVEESARRIVEEQEELGNQGILLVKRKLWLLSRIIRNWFQN